jgi:hypothetical protein
VDILASVIQVFDLGFGFAVAAALPSSKSSKADESKAFSTASDGAARASFGLAEINKTGARS